GLPLALAGGVALLAMGVARGSSHWSGGGGIDSRDRLLVLPWAMAWAGALQPPLAAWWRGAMVGLACAGVVAFVQVVSGLDRASAWVNAVWLAGVVLLLMVLRVFCRPRRSWPWTVFGLAGGVGAIVCSGRRGAWPGTLLLRGALVLGSGWKSWPSRLQL